MTILMVAVDICKFPDMLSVTPQLNLDVLREVCSFLTVVQDVLSFSLTCSALRTIAIERRLTMRPITISHAQSLRDLYHFVFVNKERRGPHLRAIQVEVPMNISREDLSEDLADHFLALLASATRLRTLTLYVPGSPLSLFTGHPDVLPAVAQLTSLRELNIAASIEEVVVLLESTRSSLKAFRYQPTYESHKSSDSLTESQTISVAPQLATALEEIEAPSDFLMVASRTHASFPAVRSLTLTDPEGDEAFRGKVNPLLRLFPNLDRTLIIDTDIYDRPAALRAANREAQKKRAWTALDRVACTNPDVLYALGLTCPIRHLTLELNLERMHGNGPVFQRSVDEVRAVLEEAASSHLALIHDGLSGGFSALYKSLFPPDSDTLANLTYLVVETGYMSLFRRDPRHGPHGDTHEDSKADTILVSLSITSPGHTHSHPVRLTLTFRLCHVHGYTGLAAAVRPQEFTLHRTRRNNILHLPDDQFELLRQKVASCMTLLVSHFDILGARSAQETKREKERQEELLRQQASHRRSDEVEEEAAFQACPEDQDSVLAYADPALRAAWQKASALAREIDEQRAQMGTEYHIIGRVLDERVLVDRSVVFLAGSSSNVSIRWQQSTFIGAGSFGSVYLAINLDSNTLMAVKEIKHPGLHGEMAERSKAPD
ncbi:hypothetical protein GSI_08207 [Ganoderma sinense ZZ0214-1]|uniref:Protein kinase domain-containing protein n=1 Tax=Ganoderma sinense ZZ0214-1 TaxID=1077348 RepID=A0A2G8S733_9APHY|nr:hypothetical protein GSI_08207 [Ganoderma sinense ZZ0214-1]